MKKVVIIFIFLFVATSSFSQNFVKYYKNEDFKEEVTQENAKYSMSTIFNLNGSVTQEARDLYNGIIFGIQS